LLSFFIISSRVTRSVLLLLCLDGVGWIGPGARPMESGTADTMSAKQKHDPGIRKRRGWIASRQPVVELV